MATIFVLERSKIMRFFCWVLLFVIGFIVATQWSEIQRSLYGVKDGITLEGQHMSRLLPEEVEKIVQEMAKIYSLQPRDAGFFTETGEIIPEKPGRGVEVEETVRRVLTALPGEDVELVTYSIPATVGKDYFIPVFQGDPSRKEVCLCVNVAWGEEELPKMLSILDRHGVKATFFFVGSWVEKFPDLVRRVAREGHEVANHGLYHGHPNKMSRDELKRLVLENQRLLEEVTGKKSPKIFAPPYGEFNDHVLSVLGNLGFRTIMWTVDTIDWKRPEPGLIIKRVKEKTKPGTIILTHPTAPTVEALDRIIEFLKKEGYTFATVSRIIRENNENKE